MNDVVREANSKIQSWGDSCNQRQLTLGTLEQYVEVQVTEVKRRYDRFGNLIAETIRELRVKLKVTKDKEVSQVPILVEILIVVLRSICGVLKNKKKVSWGGQKYTLTAFYLK